MAPSTKPRKSVKKAPAKKATSRKAASTASKQGPRSSKHGNVSYFSVPKENPECYRRCSPPYRHVDKPTGTRTTLVKYSHRNLTITSPGMSEQVRPAAKKAPAKAPAKKTAVKTPAKKKAPAKAAQCGCAVAPAKKVTKRAPAKKTPFKAPASWTVPAVGGVFRGPEPAAKKKVPAKKTVSPVKAQVMADIQNREARRKAIEKIITDVSVKEGFFDVKFKWDPSPGRTLSTVRWTRQGLKFVWDIPLRFADVDPKQVQDIFGYVLSRITGSGYVKDLSPSSVLELRRHGLKLKEYDGTGVRLPGTTVPQAQEYGAGDRSPIKKPRTAAKKRKV